MAAAECGNLEGGKAGGVADVLRDAPLALTEAGVAATVVVEHAAGRADRALAHRGDDDALAALANVVVAHDAVVTTEEGRSHIGRPSGLDRLRKAPDAFCMVRKAPG
jgi:glycogen synthase